MLKNYLKIAYKVLLRQKFFTFVSLFGISITLTILFVVVAMVDTVLSPGGRGSKLDRSLFIEQIYLGTENRQIQTLPSYQLLDHYVRPMKTPEAVSIVSENRSMAVYVGGRKLQLDLKYTDAAFWDIVGMRFIEGVPYNKSQVDNADAVAVISDRTREEVFGEGPSVGEYIETTSGTFRVIGVVPQREMPGQLVYADIWAPITQSPQTISRTEPYGSQKAIVLPATEADAPAVRDEFARQLDAIRTDLAGEWDSVTCVIASPIELATQEFGMTRSGGVSMAIATFVVLMVLFMLLPAMNLINMNISRIFERSSEIGVRKAFGASSSMLVWQFIVENVVLTLAGGVLAVILSLITLHILNTSGVIPFAQFELNWRVLAYSLVLSVFFGVFSGVLPAYRMSRLHPVEALRGVTT